MGGWSGGRSSWVSLPRGRAQAPGLQGKEGQNTHVLNYRKLRGCRQRSISHPIYPGEQGRDAPGAITVPTAGREDRCSGDASPCSHPAPCGIGEREGVGEGEREEGGRRERGGGERERGGGKERERRRGGGGGRGRRREGSQLERLGGRVLFPVHAHRLGEDGGANFIGKRRCPSTYVFVQELAQVPVVQVNKLGRALLLPLHPGAHVLAARLRVQVGALPVPAEDKAHGALCSPAEKVLPGLRASIYLEGSLGGWAHSPRGLSGPKQSAPSARGPRVDRPRCWSALASCLEAGWLGEEAEVSGAA